MRPLLIGQAPGPNTDPALPLFPIPKTSAGGRLQELTGLSLLEYVKTFDRVNLLPYFPGKWKRDDKFPMSPAKLAAAAVRPHLVGRTVILVGRNVANAFGLEIPFHHWHHMVCKRGECLKKCDGLCRVAIIPHTSGRCHWYNDEVNQAEAKAFWRVFTQSLP